MFSKFASRKTIRRNLQTGRWIAANPDRVEADIERGTILVRIARANKTRPAGRLQLIEVPWDGKS